MSVLLEGAGLQPVTDKVGFIQAPLDRVVEGFSTWQAPIFERFGDRLLATPSPSGSLEDLLARLWPLETAIRHRLLFVPTTSDWTAFFENSALGTDAKSQGSYLAEALKCHAVAVTSRRPDVGRDPRQHFGARQLELYGPEPTQFLNHIRSISLTEDDGRWRFDTDGTVQPFEDSERYSARKVVDRFTDSMLVEYCSALGLQPFDPAFYRPGDGVLVERIGPP